MFVTIKLNQEKGNHNAACVDLKDNYNQFGLKDAHISYIPLLSPE